MRLNLLDIDRFIEEKGLKEVSSQNILDGVSFDLNGLWSEVIFGRIGSRERASKFGYIDLKDEFIHPEVFPFLKKLSPEIGKIISEEKRYTINEKNKFVEDSENGETGLTFLIRIVKDGTLKFKPVSNKEKKDVADFLEKNRDIIVINKYLVIPPGGIRDIDIGKKQGRIQTSEINSSYQQILYLSKSLSGDIEFDNAIMNRIQRNLLLINSFLKSMLKGKRGILRNDMLNKSIDFSGRLVLVSSPKIKLGTVGIPWSTLLTLYEPLVSHQINKNENIRTRIQDYMDIDNLSQNDIHKFIGDINKNPDIIELDLRDEVIEVLEKAIVDGVVLIKRDPVVGTKSWFSATPIVLREGRIAIVSTLDLDPMGGDSDGDTVLVAPLFTKEAKEQARERMNPINSKLKWSETNNYGSNATYNINLDAAATIFKVTKV